MWLWYIDFLAICLFAVEIVECLKIFSSWMLDLHFISVKIIYFVIWTPETSFSVISLVCAEDVFLGKFTIQDLFNYPAFYHSYDMTHPLESATMCASRLIELPIERISESAVWDKALISRILQKLLMEALQHFYLPTEDDPNFTGNKK